MNYLGKVTDPKDFATKEYVDNHTPTPATDQEIENRTANKMIDAAHLDKAVKSSLASTTETMSDVQKQHAQDFLGTVPLVFTLSDNTTVTLGVVAHTIIPSN